MRNRIWTAALCFLPAMGCSDDPPDTTETGPTGVIELALNFDGPRHDVELMRYTVHLADQTCDDAPLYERTVPLEFEPLPLEPDTNHPFADALFVMQPGEYLVCVYPLTAEGVPTEHCAPVSGTAEVFPAQTTEIVLYAECLGDPTGNLDVVTGLNDPPQIDNLDLDPSKFIDTCEALTVTVTASDPNDDPLAYAWAILAGPPGASLVGAGPSAVFNAAVAGDYEVGVEVTDPHGATAETRFPIHVSPCGAHPDECELALVLDGQDRNVAVNDGNDGIEFCDQVGHPAQSPDWQGPSWYRFLPPAGTQMPEDPPPIFSCGTDAPGWLNGPHPAVADGVVNRQVCHHFEGDVCRWSEDIRVRNCGDFFVYDLPVTYGCRFVYCAE